MAEDKSEVGAADRARVATSQDYEVDDIARKFGLTADEVRKLIEKHGSGRAELERAAAEFKKAKIVP